MKKVYIVSAKRTAIGSFLGSFKDTKAVKLAENVVKVILEETNLDPKYVDELIMGNVLSAGIGQGGARQVAINSGIPVEVPAYGVNMICGSGMKSVINAYTSICCGLSSCIIAGGFESMSLAPFLSPPSLRTGYKMGDFKMEDHMIKDGLTDVFNNYHMGVTAENIAEKYQISRQEQDEFAYESQLKAIKAVDDGLFDAEIVPIEVKVKKDTIIVNKMSILIEKQI